MTTHDTLATTATTHCDQQGTPPPSVSPTQPDDPTPQIHLHLAQRIRHSGALSAEQQYLLATSQADRATAHLTGFSSI